MILPAAVTPSFSPVSRKANIFDTVTLLEKRVELHDDILTAVIFFIFYGTVTDSWNRFTIENQG